jgi:hypothetical protein
MGFGLIQTFHVKNTASEMADGKADWRMTSRPDFAWVLVTAAGLVVFLYGFIGFWLCERKRKLWRINLHRTPPPYHTMTVTIRRVVDRVGSVGSVG